MAKIIEFPTRPTQGAGDRQHRVSFTLKPHLHEAVEIYHQTWFAPYPASYYKSLLYNELIEKALLLCLIEHQTATIWAQICRFFDEHPDVQGLIEQNFRTPEMRHAFWRGSEKDENGTRRVTREIAAHWAKKEAEDNAKAAAAFDKIDALLGGRYKREETP